MSVLGNTARATDFHYFREGTEGVDSSGLFCAPKLKLSEWTPPPVSAVFMSIDDFLRHRGVEETEPTELVEPADDATATKLATSMCGHRQGVEQCCLYLQHRLLKLGKDGLPEAADDSNGRIGQSMRRDIEEGLNMERLHELSSTFGKFKHSQLFVGTHATSNARSTLHFDQMDNLFLQIAGRKRFVIYEPTEAGNLYAWPVHHPLDRRAQVDLRNEDDARFPRLAKAIKREVILEPGDLLFLPAYWWHEVTTLPVQPNEITVSINFWYTLNWQTQLDRLPLRGTFLLEAARQLEMFVAEMLGSPRLLPPSCAAGRQMRAIREGRVGGGTELWEELHDE